jgi:molybdenum cofactor synthesis domain-containing protein
MDGFALRAVDVLTASTEPVRLRCMGQALTGAIYGDDVAAGHCVEIATGAPIPTGADAVVMVERTSRELDTVLVHEAVSAGQNIGRRGSDIQCGDTVVRRGDHISPARAGAVAAIGSTKLSVFAKPSVAIFSTGPEVAGPGRPTGPGQIHDVNTTTLAAVVTLHGGRPRVMPAVDDVAGALAAALVNAAAEDLIVWSGGSSVGRRDVLTDALAMCGRVVFHGVAVKPGKPTLFGYVGDTPLFGMPGNPTSCLSNAYLFLVPFLRATARLPAWQPMRTRAPLARTIRSNANRHQFYTVKLESGRVVPAFKSSGDITSMADADGYIEIPADVSTIEAGEVVTVILF